MAELLAICRVEDVPEGCARTFEAAGVRLAVFHDSGAFHALFDRCPHAGGSLGGGWIDDGEAVCPLHRWRFKLENGRCSTIRGFSVSRFSCEVRDGQVWVLV